MLEVSHSGEGNAKVRINNIVEMLELGSAAHLNVGTTAGTVASGDHQHVNTPSGEVILGEVATSVFGTGPNDVARGNHTHSDLSPVNHSHDNYSLSTHVHPTLASINHTHPDLSPVTHVHSEYSTKNHAHPEYSVNTHTHSEYSTIGHIHSDYADIAHSHDSYANKVHTHTEYSLKDHIHDDYASLTHDHDDRYASKVDYDSFVSSTDDRLTNCTNDISVLNDNLNTATTDLNHRYEYTYSKLGLLESRFDSQSLIITSIDMDARDRDNDISSRVTVLENKPAPPPVPTNIVETLALEW